MDYYSRKNKLKTLIQNIFQTEKNQKEIKDMGIIIYNLETSCLLGKKTIKETIAEMDKLGIIKIDKRLSEQMRNV